MQINTLFKYWTYRLFAPGVVLRRTYEAFRELLVHDSRCHEFMADLEALYYQGKREDLCRVALRYGQLAASVEGMVSALERMAPGSHVTLREYFRKFDFYSRLLLAPPTLDFGPPFTLPLTDPRATNPALVGHKAANLAALSTAHNLPVPEGFVITVNSFNYLLEYNDLRGSVTRLLEQLEPADPQAVESASSQLCAMIRSAELPPAVGEAILAAVAETFAAQGGDVNLIARSSAVGEDGESSFAGQYASIADLSRDTLLDAYREVLASKYFPEALAYRIHTGFGDEETPMAVLVMEMIDPVASGVVYTVRPDRKDERRLGIHTVPGRGEGLVGGRLVAEVIEVDRQSLTLCVPQAYGAGEDGIATGILDLQQASELARLALGIEAHFNAPQDIEWALTSEESFLFLQSRPLSTTPGGVATMPREPLAEETDCQVLLRGGNVAAPGHACGPLWLVDGDHPVAGAPQGAILVVTDTPPSLVQRLSRIVGVLAESGSVAGHFATVCREFGVPLLCGIGRAVRDLPHGEVVTLLATEGKVCRGDVLPTAPPLPAYQSQAHLPYFQRLRRLLDGITPLALTDPRAANFTPEGCRTFHDIIRFCHEQAVRIMFSLGDRLGKPGRSRRRLITSLPFDIFFVDVGGGLKDGAADEATAIDHVASRPFLQLWRGLTHPDIHWHEQPAFDWKNFGETVLADGITSVDSPEFASYAVLAGDYVNLIMRFGYHFTLVDALCGEDEASNYCQFRFAGGGADLAGRQLRLAAIARVLQQAGFEVETRGDLLDARLPACPAERMQEPLVILGRLLGATRLMDMTLGSADEASRWIDDFLSAT